MCLAGKERSASVQGPVRLRGRQRWWADLQRRGDHYHTGGGGGGVVGEYLCLVQLCKWICGCGLRLTHRSSVCFIVLHLSCERWLCCLFFTLRSVFELLSFVGILWSLDLVSSYTKYKFSVLQWKREKKNPKQKEKEKSNPLTQRQALYTAVVMENNDYLATAARPHYTECGNIMLYQWTGRRGGEQPTATRPLPHQLCGNAQGLMIPPGATCQPWDR